MKDYLAVIMFILCAAGLFAFVQMASDQLDKTDYERLAIQCENLEDSRVGYGIAHGSQSIDRSTPR